MTLTRIALPICICLSVAACGGGGGSTGTAPSFDDLVDEALALSEFTEPLDISPSIPAAGQASYAGIMALDNDLVVEGEALIADAQIEVDFGANTLDGDVTRFFSAEYDSAGDPVSDGTRVPGALTLSADTIAAGLFNVSISGSLDFEGETRVASGTLVTAFGGTMSEAIVGFAEEITLSGTTTSFFGALLAREE